MSCSQVTLVLRKVPGTDTLMIQMVHLPVCQRPIKITLTENRGLTKPLTTGLVIGWEVDPSL
jgi:hypothetical protein